jgi:KaiC/GvpD/RAD55 family RecA-like ATPase
MYKNSTDTVGVEVSYKKVLNAISEGKYQPDIQNLHLLLQSGEVDRYTESKKMLPSVTFAGTFTKRAMDSLKEWSSMIVLDIDGLTPAQLTHYKKTISEDVHVHALFVSPSQAGLKIIIKLLSFIGPDNHLKAFLALEEYFKQSYAIALDKSGKDISRLCYVSYDPELYFNENSECFAFKPEEIVTGPMIAKFDERPDKFKGYIISKDAKYAFKVCEQWTQRHHQYEQGNRNNYIHVLSCNMNRAGIHIDDAMLMIYNTYPDLPYKEIETTVNSAYRRESEHNTIDIYNTDQSNLPEHTEDLGLDAQSETIYEDTKTLLNANIPKNLIAKLIKNFGIAFFGMEEKQVGDVMNLAVKKHKDDLSTNSLDSTSADEALMRAIESYKDSGGISTLVPEVDEATNGGLMPGSFYGFIGKGGSFKSILAQCIGAEGAKDGEVVLYLNGEMSELQLLDRMVNKELEIDLLGGLRDKTITREHVPQIAKELKEILKDNFEMVSSTGWNKETITKTVQRIEAKLKKKVRLIIADGLTQMEDVKRDEIKSAIHNSGVLKEIAKDSNVAVAALIHVSGGIEKHVRDTSKFVRGGDKVINNMDAMFCTSLLIDEPGSDMENGDLMYIKNKFYLRFIDKRGSGAIISKIIQVNRPMKLVALDIDPSAMEIKIG